jgi:hypothetical protein
MWGHLRLDLVGLLVYDDMRTIFEIPMFRDGARSFYEQGPMAKKKKVFDRGR